MKKNYLKNKKPKIYQRKRIRFITFSIIISLTALAFIVNNFRDNIVFFYSPSELENVNVKNNQIIRVGAMVKKGSIKNQNGQMEFIITDYKSELKIQYYGIKPNLFREGQGIVAKGIWDQKNQIFIANELLAKHDENYMPPEVKKAMEGSNSSSN